jgi:hypothetical protein
MLSNGYAILYQIGKRYVHRAIFYLNKHKENNMKLYQKKVQPAYFSCQEMDDILGAGGGAGSGGGGRITAKWLGSHNMTIYI